MKFNRWASMSVLAATMLTVSPLTMDCVSADPQEAPNDTAAPTPADKRALCAANNEFALKLYREIAKAPPKDKENGNLFVSPLSVSMALAMTWNGAAGDTATAMAQTLGYDKLGQAKVNEIYRQWLVDLSSAQSSSSNGATLNIANSLWGRNGIAFKDDFLARCRDSYHARAEVISFDDAGKQIVNGWVSEKTNGKIQNLIDRMPPDAFLYLVNAVYFKGTWQYQFDKAKTTQETFTTAAGKAIKHARMSMKTNLLYHQGENAQIAALPYAGGGDMVIVLPSKGTDLKTFAANLTSENWTTWTDSMEHTKGTIAIPRFKAEYDVELSKALKALGMEIAFDDTRADFTGMGTPPNKGRAYIGRVLHKAFVGVNEEGTEAAAATAVEMKSKSARPNDFTMIVDRPFFFAIRDSNGTLMFTGSIGEPVDNTKA